MKKSTAFALTLALTVVAAACADQSAPNGITETSLPASSTAEPFESASPEPPPISPDPFYLEIVKEKEALVVVAAERARIYRAGDGGSLNPNHHMPWPSDFPSATGLPAIERAGDFSIRQTKEASEMLGGVYLAISVADGYEMRLDVARFQDFEGVRWGSGNTWFSKAGEEDWDNWVLSDS